MFVVGGAAPAEQAAVRFGSVRSFCFPLLEGMDLALARQIQTLASSRELSSHPPLLGQAIYRLAMVRSSSYRAGPSTSEIRAEKGPPANEFGQMSLM